jgi:hypothetical protein
MTVHQWLLGLMFTSYLCLCHAQRSVALSCTPVIMRASLLLCLFLQVFTFACLASFQPNAYEIRAVAASTFSSAKPANDVQILAATLISVTRDVESLESISTSSFRVRWTTPPAAVPLIHSLFAEWNTETQSSTIQSVNVCDSVSMVDDSGMSECIIPADTLPLNVPLSLRILTECDHVRMQSDALQWALDASHDSAEPYPIRRCRSAMSHPWHVKPPQRSSQRSLQSTQRTSSIPLRSAGRRDWPIPTNHRIQVPRHVALKRGPSVSQYKPPKVSVSARPLTLREPPDSTRTALCRLFNVTDGVRWNAPYGWCSNSVPLCMWSGVHCSADQSQVQTLVLSGVGLRLTDRGGSINFVWDELTSLQSLWLDGNVSAG